MKAFQRLLAVAPVAALLPVAMAPASSLASDLNLNLDGVQEYSVAQGASIRDFSDVYPTDWAYQALAELVENYGCVSGYPDGTFRGDRPITRFEMAAILNKCMNAMSAKMDMMGDDEMASMEDMETLERLVASFEEELITLKGAVDGLDAKVTAMEDSQFSTTTKAAFKISTDFTYFASEDMNAKMAYGYKYRMNTDGTYMMKDGKRVVASYMVPADSSGIALTSKAEVAFTTSFTGSDKLTFKLKGNVIGSDYHPYLKGGYDFYDTVKGTGTNVKFTGFSYEAGMDMGGMMLNLMLGTDVDDLDPIVGLDTYYGGSGYDGYGPSEFGDAGVGLSLDLLSSGMGSLIASASYAVDAEDASTQTMRKGTLGEDTDRSGVLALSWDGALFGGNNAMFTVAYQNTKMNNYMMGSDLTKSYFHLVAGAYFMDTLSLSGSYSFGTWNYAMQGMKDMKSAQWMVGVNMDDAFFPGNSAGIAYGTPEYTTDPKTNNAMKVLEVYYSFKVNDHFELPVYLDFINNVGNMNNSDAWGVAVRPTLTF